MLYTRPGCKLCEQARERILELREAGLALQLSEVDIASEERLHAAYLERIPVIEVDGRTVSELWLDERALSAALSVDAPAAADSG